VSYTIEYKRKLVGDIKWLKSPGYNYVFNTTNGSFARWGTTFDEDPQFSPFGPELADIEISTICHKGCKWCYKSNTADGKNMSLADFHKILAKLPDTVCQIAFGIGDIDSNPDMYEMFKAARHRIIVPNVTVNGVGVNDWHASRLASICGAVAVSHYDDDECFDTVYKLNNYGLKQVNIHKLLSEETYDSCMELVDKVVADKRLEKLNAIVFLSLKRTGRGTDMHLVEQDKFNVLIEKCMKAGIGIGFDSCSCGKFLRAVKGHPRFSQFMTVAEPCESTLFSVYINVDGIAYPCSFNESKWKGTPVPDVDFINDVWNGKPFEDFRKMLTGTNRECPIYQV
jgi:MoaA/NifB/PqqE/SkfB family radical SAM enzyme